MFEDAKRKYLDSLSSRYMPSGVENLNNYSFIWQEIENIARKHAAEYFRAQGAEDDIDGCCGSSHIEFEKIVETYKLLIVPDNTLQGYLQAMGQEAARREFRRIAMLIHPDKNSHPNAKIAFQKLYLHFKGVISESE
jgi:hypothetical protein